MPPHKILPSEVELLTKLKERIDESWVDLTKWEQGFIEDVIERFNQYGDRMLISSKQIDCLLNISEKVF